MAGIGLSLWACSGYSYDASMSPRLAEDQEALNPGANHSSERRLRLILSALLLGLAGVWFVWDVFQRPPGMMDFHVLCNASRCWLAGVSPYRLETTQAQWRTSGGEMIGPITGQFVVYPPSAFPVLVPLAILSPAISGLTWFVLEVVALLAFLTLAWRHASSSHQLTPQVAFFTLVALQWWPVKMAIFHGQLALPAALMAFAAIVAVEKKSPRIAGVLLGISLAIKPHMAIAAAAFLLLRRQWSPLRYAVAVWGIAMAVGAVQLYRSGNAHWLGEWQRNLQTAASDGHTSDFVSANSSRFDMINLQVPLYDLLHLSAAANITSLIIFAGLAVAFLVLYRWRRVHDVGLEFALLAALSLLPVYHRTPDLCLLLPALAWSLMGHAPLLPRAVVCVSLLPMLIPAPLLNLFVMAYIPVASSVTVTDPFRACSTLLATVALLFAMGCNGMEERHQQDPLQVH